MATFADMMLSAAKDERDKTYGRLYVVREAGRTRQGAVTWLCRCSCSEIVEVAGSDLRRGHTRSCGCLQPETIAESNVTKPRRPKRKEAPQQ